MTERCRDPKAELQCVMDDVAAIADIIGCIAVCEAHTSEGASSPVLHWLSQKLMEADQRGHEVLVQMKERAG